VVALGTLDEQFTTITTPLWLHLESRTTLRLNGRTYVATGQAVGSLHTMLVLQAYQAYLLKDLDHGQGLSP